MAEVLTRQSNGTPLSHVGTSSRSDARHDFDAACCSSSTASCSLSCSLRRSEHDSEHDEGGTMHDDELTEIVNNLRTLGSDVADIEAKRAEGGLPRSIRETFSAFANTRGGTLLLGLDESSGFAATGLKNPAKMQADLAALCSAEMEPPLRPEIGVHDFEGTKVLVAEVPELPRANKPCYFRGGGIVNGSYVRVADGDRKLTSYEVQLMLANRGQPRHDEEPVPGTGADDLDSDLVGALVSRLREGRPHAFSGLDDAAILRRMKVLVPRDGADVLSLAGLLALGRSPQEHFPQLMLTFVHYPTEKGAAPSTGLRYLDSIVAEGPIPVIVQDAMFALRPT